MENNNVACSFLSGQPVREYQRDPASGSGAMTARGCTRQSIAYSKCMRALIHISMFACFLYLEPQHAINDSPVFLGPLVVFCSLTWFSN